MLKEDELRKEIVDLKVEKVKIEINAIAASEDGDEYSYEDEEALFECEMSIQKLEAQLEDLLEEASV